MMVEPEILVPFLRESNKIEGILREPTAEEIVGTQVFLRLSKLTLTPLTDLVYIYAGATLRRHHGMDVRVGNHIPPRGGPHVEARVIALLDDLNDGLLDAYRAHLAYENLHPFMDGNGRSGRTIWLWKMLRSGSRAEDQALRLGFLHTFYYQTLDAGDRKFGL